jgi:hypothetical protein
MPTISPAVSLIPSTPDWKMAQAMKKRMGTALTALPPRNSMCCGASGAAPVAPESAASFIADPCWSLLRAPPAP